MCSCYTVSLGMIIFVTVGFGRVWVYACWFTRVGACEKQSDQKLAGKNQSFPLHCFPSNRSSFKLFS